MTIKSRCRVVTLRTPPVAAVADVLVQRDGVDREMAEIAARMAQGHVGQARRLATEPEARNRRASVMAVPRRLTSVGPAVAAAEAIVKAADAEAKTQTEKLDEEETSALRKALGE